MPNQINLTLAILKMIPEFVRMGRFYSVRAAIDQVRKIFLHVPDLYLFDSHTSANKRSEKNDDRLRALLFQLQASATREMSFLKSLLDDELTSVGCLCEIHARLSMMLHENAPLARTDEDNCLVDIEIPLSYFGIGDKYLTECHSHPEALSDYVLTRSCPRLPIARLDYLAAIWMDFDVSFYIGHALNDSPEQLNNDELEELLSWPLKIMGDEFDSLSSASMKQDFPWLCTLDQLIRRLKRLQKDLDYELPEDLLSMEFTAILDCLASAWHDINSLHSAQIQRQHHAAINSDYVKNVERLDKTMRQFEHEAQLLIKSASHVANAAGPETWIFMRESNPAEIANCTLWTRNNGALSDYFPGLPLISVPYISESQIGDGENWSETSAISNMGYLTHVFAHDSFIPWHDLGYADYITIRVDCSRQLYRNFSDGI